MVCYNSISPILYFSFASFNFYALLFFLLRSTPLLFIFSSTLYTLCCLCILFTVPWISPSDYALCLVLPTCITLEKEHSLLCSSCLSHAKFSMRSSLQLFIFSGGYSESVHHQWLLSKDSLASLAVVTLCLLCQFQPVILDSFDSKPLPSCDHRR
jgi:hypothetical protein